VRISDLEKIGDLGARVCGGRRWVPLIRPKGRWVWASFGPKL
jgi:hypothetical protein